MKLYIILILKLSNWEQSKYKLLSTNAFKNTQLSNMLQSAFEIKFPKYTDTSYSNVNLCRFWFSTERFQSRVKDQWHPAGIPSDYYFFHGLKGLFWLEKQLTFYFDGYLNNNRE